MVQKYNVFSYVYTKSHTFNKILTLKNCVYCKMSIPLHSQTIRISNNILKQNTMIIVVLKNGKELTTPTELMYLLGVIKPIEDVLKDLQENTLINADYPRLDNILHHYMQTLLDNLGVDLVVKREQQPKYVKNAPNAPLNEEDKKMFIKHFSFIKEQYEKFL